MEKYTWNKKILIDYMLDPFIAPDFNEMFSFLEDRSKCDEVKMSPLRVIFRDCNFFDLNPFIPESFEGIIDENSMLYKTVRAKRPITIESALKLTNGFYSSLDADIRSVFQKQWEKNSTHLMATYPSKVTSTAAFTGHCFCSEAAKDCFIEFYASKNYDMLSILIHEYAHAIAFALRNYTYTTEGFHAFTEIESIFMELHAADWLKNNSGFGGDIPNAITKVRNDILDTARYSLETYDLCSMLMDMHLHGQYIDMNSIIAKAKKEFGDMDKGYILELLESPIDMTIPYGYSGLIAIELYYIYKQDPKCALDLYKRIIRMNEPTAIKMSYAINKMGITPGKHFDEFSRTLKR